MLSIAAENAVIFAAFNPSYQYLPSGRQRFFRCLGLHPGTTIAAYAASAPTSTTLPRRWHPTWTSPSTVRVCLPRPATTGTAHA